jgi:opacity protein-like surface antigen
MKKRVFLVLLIAVLATSAAFAQPEFKVSVGVGAFFENDFGGGVNVSTFSITEKIETPYSGEAIYGFFDLTYLELSFGYFFGRATIKETVGLNFLGINVPLFSYEETYKVTSYNLGLMAKYPIAIGNNFSFFPLLGIECKGILSLEDDYGTKLNGADDFDSLWFKFGVGGDISMTENIFLRLNVLYGIRATNKFERDTEKELYVSAYEPGQSVDTNILKGHGLTAKLAIGFRF